MFTFFYPGRSFPAISITGSECELNCKHCNHHYLGGMKDARDPEVLYTVLRDLSDAGGIGALISGGSNRDGKVPLVPFLQVLERIKRETELVLNVHTGFIDRKEARALAGTGVDIVSFDVVGSVETIRKVYGLNRGPEDSMESLRNLKESGIPFIVPHITVGLHFGELKGELYALDMIRETFEPDGIVINVMIPTRDTGMKNAPTPSNEDVLSVIQRSAELFKAPILLGCMRPKGNTELELLGEEAGLSGIVLPSARAREIIQGRRECRVVEACCALFPIHTP